MLIQNKIRSKFLYPIERMILNINYLLNNYKEVVWLLGDGRSGTTWVSNLIKEEKLYREMFETFHPLLVDKFSFLLPHQYMRPEVSNERFKQFSSDVFSGKFTHPRVDFSNHSLVYKGLILKDIFANLFAYWVSIRFPQIKIILLLRNPFSVAISKNRKKEWYWLTEPLNLLEQPDLYEDYLVPFADIIRDVSDDIDYITSQVLIWSIINYVPLRQFKPDKIHIVFYEDMLINPNHEVAKIFHFLIPEYW